MGVLTNAMTPPERCSELQGGQKKINDSTTFNGDDSKNTTGDDGYSSFTSKNEAMHTTRYTRALTAFFSGLGAEVLYVTKE